MGVYKAASCDICGKEKEVSNHWWLACVESYDDKNGKTLEQFTLEPFDLVNYEPSDGDKIICGNECAVKALGQYMSCSWQGVRVRAVYK